MEDPVYAFAFKASDDKKAVLNAVFDLLHKAGYEFEYQTIEYPNDGSQLLYSVTNKNWNSDQWSGKRCLICTKAPNAKFDKWNKELDHILGRVLDPKIRRKLINHCSKAFKK